MMADQLLQTISQAGGRVTVDGGNLVLKAPRPLPDDLLAEVKRHKPELLAALTQPANLDTLLAQVCQGVEGIDAATFRALLSPEDAEDIEGGHIPVVTLNAYAKSFADGIRCGRIKVLAAAVPKPVVTERVRCADCRHFERDTIGDGSGIGGCKIDGEGAGPKHPALWTNAERECKDFERVIMAGSWF